MGNSVIHTSEELTAILERITDSFISLDENWCFTFINEKAGHTFYRDPEKLIGKKIWTEFPNGLHQPFGKAYLKAMTEQKYVHLEEYYSPWDKWFESHIYPSPNGLSVFIRDITVRKGEEKEIKLHEHQLRLIYDSASDPIFLLSVEKNERYKFMSVNKSFLNVTGLKPEQLLNQYVNDIIPQPSLQVVLEKYNAAVESKVTVKWEEVSQYPAGIKTGVVSVTPIYDENGDCIRLVGSVHDITERKKADLELQRMNEQLRSLSIHLQTISETERTAIAREIHDVLGQQMTALKYDIAGLRKKKAHSDKETETKLESMNALVDETIHSIRKVSSELRPRILDDLGLNAAIEWYISDFQKNTGITCHFSSNLEDIPFEKHLSITIFRIMQEALTNVARHSKATEVYLVARHGEKGVSLTINDNGKGITEEEKINSSSLGILGMKERAKMIGGLLDITGSKDKGSTLTLTIPNFK
jgi:PAS domain S-box-containing protein